MQAWTYSLIPRKGPLFRTTSLISGSHHFPVHPLCSSHRKGNEDYMIGHGELFPHLPSVPLQD